MFPLTSNEAYIKSTGERSTLGKMLEEGGNEPIEAKLNDEIAARAALGAHNFLPLYSITDLKENNTSGTWADNVYTVANVTITPMTDDNGNVIGAKLNGTSNGEFVFAMSGTFDLPAEDYILSTPNLFPGSKSVYMTLNTPEVGVNINTAKSRTFTQTTSTAHRVYIYSGADRTFDNFEVYPMIRRADDANDTFYPYAMTNQELTAALNPVNSTDFTFSNATGNGYIYKDGHIGVISLDITPSDTADTTVTLPSGYTLAQNFYQKHTTNSNTIYAYGYTNGTTFKISHSNTDEIMISLPVALK